MILKLDEAKEFMIPALFTSFEGAYHHYKCDYVSMHSRNLFKPIGEMWDVEMKFMMVAGMLNPE